MQSDYILKFAQKGKNAILSYLKRKSCAKIPESHIGIASGTAENRILVELDVELASATGLSTIEIKEGRALAWSYDGKVTLDSLDAIEKKLKKGVDCLQSYGYKYNGHYWYDSLKWAV